MAYTERYVSALAAGGGDGLSAGSPWTWDEARVACVPGTRVNVKADGTYNLTANEGTSDKHYMALYLGRPDAPICWRGYGTTPGDGVRVNINMGSVMLMISPAASGYVVNRGCWVLENFDITGSNTKSPGGVLYDTSSGSRTRPLLINCRVSNTYSGTSANQALAASLTGPIAINCEFSSAHRTESGATKNTVAGTAWRLYGCRVYSAGGVCQYPTSWVAVRTLFIGGPSAQIAFKSEFATDTSEPVFEHCVFDGFSTVFDCSSGSADVGFVQVRNCIFRNCAKVFGDSSGADQRHYFVHGNFAWNVSGIYDFFNLNGSAFGYASNDMWPFRTITAVASDPFVDAANGDYRITQASGLIDTALPMNDSRGTAMCVDVGVFDITPVEDYPDEDDVRFGVDYKSGVMTGACHVPVPADVRHGEAVDATTGTCHVPPAADVRSGVPVESTVGTCAVPANTDTKHGVPVDDTLGTCHVPIPADVRFDVDVAQTVGTCHVPDPEDVKRGVAVESTVGTFDARRDLTFKDESSVS